MRPVRSQATYLKERVQHHDGPSLPAPHRPDLQAPLAATARAQPSTHRDTHDRTLPMPTSLTLISTKLDLDG